VKLLSTCKHFYNTTGWYRGGRTIETQGAERMGAAVSKDVGVGAGSHLEQPSRPRGPEYPFSTGMTLTLLNHHECMFNENY
jgi:hypothetical protein